MHFSQIHFESTESQFGTESGSARKLKEPTQVTCVLTTRHEASRTHNIKYRDSSPPPLGPGRAAAARHRPFWGAARRRARGPSPDADRDRWLGGRDSELTGVCSRTSVCIGPDILTVQRRVMRTFVALATWKLATVALRAGPNLKPLAECPAAWLHAEQMYSANVFTAMFQWSYHDDLLESGHQVSFEDCHPSPGSRKLPAVTSHDHYLSCFRVRPISVRQLWSLELRVGLASRSYKFKFSTCIIMAPGKSLTQSLVSFQVQVSSESSH